MDGDWRQLLDASADFDPAGDLEAFLASIPGRWAVYLLGDADDRPIQLLCVKNLRASLRRRLGGSEVIGPTRKVRYRDVVRQVWWRRVDSAFEADWAYLLAARRIFPESYRGMVGFRPAWFVHVDPVANFPHFVKTQDLSERPGVLLGPLGDKHAAARLIELVEDAFDLCRYYNVLVQAPDGQACAYKEMGKCPAPCDGSISMDDYRRMAVSAMEAIIHPARAVERVESEMRSAAAELRFERAARLKATADRLSRLGKPPLDVVGRLEDFAWAVLQSGPRKGAAKMFVATAGRIEAAGCLLGEPGPCDALVEWARQLGRDRPRGVDETAAESVAVVAQHLLGKKQTQGVFLRLDELDAAALNRAWRALQKQKDQPENPDDEGMVRQLESMGPQPRASTAG